MSKQERVWKKLAKSEEENRRIVKQKDRVMYDNATLRREMIKMKQTLGEQKVKYQEVNSSVFCVLFLLRKKVERHRL